MNLAVMKKILKSFIPCFLVALILTGCATEDRPFTVISDTNEGTDSVPGGEGSGNAPPPVEGCFVNFHGTLQLKISANPTGSKEVEKLDANPVNIDPIPFAVDGTAITLFGDLFPTIVLDRLNDTVNLQVSGVPGTSATGSIDPATGEIEITGFQFNLKLLNKDNSEFSSGVEKLEGVNLSTGSVTATGNLNPISEDGKPLDSGDRSITLVMGMTLPGKFPSLQVLDNEIAGGALTAKFEGTFDELPENCSSSGPGGGEGGGPGGPGLPSGFSISDGSAPNLAEVDFGTAQVVVTKAGGETILDCRDALNRGALAKHMTIKNTGSGERKVKILAPQDTDADLKDPLCSGSSEFVRGSLSTHGSATCASVTVGGKSFATTECTIPEGDEESFISFPLLYNPYNFVGVAEDEESAPDTGVLIIEYDESEVFELKMIGRTEPDTRDVFSISKVKDGGVSSTEIRNFGTIKLPLSQDDSKPFTQELVLRNGGTDDWEEITFSFADDTSVFSVEPLAETVLPGDSGSGAGQISFNLVFNPGSEASYNDVMTVTMVRSGSKTGDNPNGTVAELTINLSGTVGLPVLSGKVKFEVDFLAAKIDHQITVAPVESLDFRDNEEQRPPPLDLIFSDTASDTIKTVSLQVENKGVQEKSLAERKNSLRILNAQATWGTPGRKLVAGEGADLCNEAPDISIPYDNSRMECSYFYFNIFGDNPGVYDDDSGHLTLPEITLRIENPYHSDIANNWLASNPNTSPSYILDTTLEVTLTTFVLDEAEVEMGEELLNLIPDERIFLSDLNVKGKKLGDECPEDILNHHPGEGTLPEKHPHLRCYLSTGERFLQGRAVQLRPGSTKEYDVIMVGIGRFPNDPNNLNTPWFMRQNGGSKMYIAIQGRLILE